MHPKSQQVRPIQRMAQAVSKCSAEVTLYGRCIMADYNSVHRDQCAKEFLKLKDCYLTAYKGVK